MTSLCSCLGFLVGWRLSSNKQHSKRKEVEAVIFLRCVLWSIRELLLHPFSVLQSVRVLLLYYFRQSSYKDSLDSSGGKINSNSQLGEWHVYTGREKDIFGDYLPKRPSWGLDIPWHVCPLKQITLFLYPITTLLRNFYDLKKWKYRRNISRF